MQKKSLSIALALIFSILILTPVQAQQSPSPSPVAVDINEVTDNLKKRLQDSLDGDSLTSAPSAMAYVGVIKDVIKDTIIVEDKDGKKDIKMSDDTTIIRSPGNATIKSENILIGDYIIAMGYPENGNNLSGKRLIVSVNAFDPPVKTSAMGVVTELKTTSLTLDISGEEQLVSLNTKTVFKSPQGSIELEDVSVGDTLIYTATVDKNDLQTATLVMQVQ